MAEPVTLTLELIGLATKVAASFMEYTRNVKDAPKVVTAIALELSILKGILEYLQSSLGSGIGLADKARVAECLKNCMGTLSELEELMTPASNDDSESSSSSPGKVKEFYRSFTPKKPNKFLSPYNKPQDRMGLNNLLPPLQALGGPEQITHRYKADPSKFSPSRIATPPPKKATMSLRARIKWPLFHQRKAEELLKQLERQKGQLNLAIQVDNSMNLSGINHTVKDIEAALDDGGKRRVLSWLKPKIDMHEFHCEQHDKQEDETCEWITNSQGWSQWLDGGSFEPGGYERFIWIFGIPGAGKTVLASFLVDAIGVHCQATGYSFYYCHHERNHDETLHFLRWIISDLSRQIERFIPQELEDLSKGETFSIPGLLSCFLAMSRRFAQRGQRVYIVVDAVDESRKPRERFLDVLIQIGTDPDFQHVSLLMTSREEHDIRNAMLRDDNDDMSPQGRGEGVRHTAITMSNSDVMRAIRMYVKNQFARNERFRQWPTAFREEVEEALARNARGMFRWVSCQIDIIERIYLDRDRVMEALGNLPDTLFDTYARILEGIPVEQRAFARTALALICSNTSNIKSADVLVQASLHNVRHGAMHMYDVRMLKEILGCLIKVTNLRKKPQYIFRRDDDGIDLQKVGIAHYTVREFLFSPAKADGKQRPAGEFALTDTDIRMLEMQVVFNGLQQWGRNRLPNQRIPSRYEEHCLEMSDGALRADRRNLIVKFESVFESVLPCLAPSSAHIKSLTNERLRRRFTRWRKLCAFGDCEGTKPARRETSILASLVLLRWPEFAQKLLRHGSWVRLSPERKHQIWIDEFSIDPLIDDNFPRTFAKGDPITLLRLCVSWKRIDFLEIFFEAGANFVNEPDIVFVALQNPYGDDNGDDGSTTGQLLKMILERGADPNPPGYRYTPLQDAVHHLEEGWVQSLLIECRDANLVGAPDGIHPYDLADRPWHKQHPLEICRTTKPIWPESDGKEDQVEKSRKQVELLLTQYGARRLLPTNAVNPIPSVVID